MRRRDYGQFCGLARAAEVLGQRWTLLILRDLLVGPRRYSDLRIGLPGIPTNMLATRLKGLESHGLVVREARSGGDRAIVYRLTPRGAEVAPALEALSRWGAAGMHAPREGEVVTEASLVSALRTAAANGSPDGGPASGGADPDGGSGTAPPVPEGSAVGGRWIQEPAVVVVRLADVAVTAVLGRDGVDVVPGAHANPDLELSGGSRLRELLGGRLDPGQALAEGAVEIEGPVALLERFITAFPVPYSPAADPGAAAS